VSNLVPFIKRTQIKHGGDQGAEENIWTMEEVTEDRKLHNASIIIHTFKETVLG
jgi:hypothetical protein